MYDNRKYIDLDRKEINYKKILGIVFLSCLFSYFLVYIAQLYFFLYYEVKLNSMHPSFNKGEKVFAVINSHLFSLKRDDVVLIRHPEYQNQVFVSRVKGLPNESLRIKDKSLWINDKKIKEDIIHLSDKRVFPKSFSTRDTYEEIRIGQGYYFVLSDNRDSAFDSRELGLVQRENIIGKVVF